MTYTTKKAGLLTGGLLLFLAATLLTAAPAGAQERTVAASSSSIAPILVGQRIADGDIYDVDGNARRLKDVLGEKPTVLVVFRGGWCIFCSRQLSQLAKSLDAFRTLGWQVVGLSPDSHEDLKKAIDDRKLGYELFSDPSASVVRHMGLAYKVSVPKEPWMKDWVSKHKKLQNTEDPALPVPAVFLVHRNGLVVYEYINVDFRVRLSGAVLLTAAKSYREKRR